MNLLETAFPASYKEVGFSVDGTTTTGGIKNVKHVFVNSDNQNIELLGVKLKSYPVRAFINNTKDEAYKLKRDNLVKVLDDQESGKLVHPFLGIIDNVIATEWTLTEDFRQFGKARFTIQFESTLPQSVPEVASNSLSQVQEKEKDVADGTKKDTEENFLITFSKNINDSISQVNSIVEEINNNSNLFSITEDQVNIFNNQVGQLSANAANLVRDPVALASSLNNVFSTISGMYVTVEAALGVMANFFNFGADDIPIDDNTISNIERKKNRKILNDNINAYSLAHAYTLASQLDFTTIEQQNEIADVLEEQYQFIIKDDVIENLSGVDELIGISTDTKLEITDQRGAVENLFDDNRIILGQIIEIITTEISTRLLSYQYYGDSELGEDIANLNNISDSSFANGTIKIISS